MNVSKNNKIMKTIKFVFLLSFLFISFLSEMTSAQVKKIDTDPSWLYHGEPKHFFFDNLIIESAQNLTRKVHQPEKYSSSPVIQKDKPWEHVTYFTVSSWQVIRDTEDGLFKCWYEDWKVEDIIEVSSHDPDKAPSRYLYAESEDGIHWKKPELSIVKENGYNTNIVFGDSIFGSVHSGWVMLDPLEERHQHRYKMLFNHKTSEFSDRKIASSPNGIIWTVWDYRPLFGKVGNSLGDVWTISADQNANIYRINTRFPRMMRIMAFQNEPYPEEFIKPFYPNDPARENRRRVFRAESSDLLQWTNLRPLLVPDSQLDNIDDAFYGMTQMPIGNDWIGFLHVFHMTENTMDVQLLYSRDGDNFNRIQPGQPWLKTGERGSWDEFMVNVFGTPVVVDDELFVYYGGANNHHDWWLKGARENLDVQEAYDLNRVNYALGLARMKLDRFVSLQALHVREGILVTTPVRGYEGDQLIINAECRNGGYIKVAVTDGEGNVIEGYEAENSNVFFGDSINHKMTWKNREKVPTDIGFIKFQFFMKNADLFSFQLKK